MSALRDVMQLLVFAYITSFVTAQFTERTQQGGTGADVNPSQRQSVFNHNPNINVRPSYNNEFVAGGKNLQPGMHITTVLPNNRHHIPDRSLTTRKKVTCRTTPCKNMGTCNYNEITGVVACVCKPFFMGEFCETMVRTPKNITLIKRGSNQLTITWVPPNTREEISGYIVQFHPFGRDGYVERSSLIHATVRYYEIRDLKEDSKYTVCVVVVFKNQTYADAVLRDQCLEVKTAPGVADLKVPIIVVIVCVIIVVFLIVIVIYLMCQRWRIMEEKEIMEKNELGEYPSTSWRKSINMNNPNIDYSQDNAVMYPHYADPHRVSVNQTNNASSAEVVDDVFYTPEKKHSPNIHPIAVRSSSVSYTNVSARNERLASFNSPSLLQFESRHKRTSSVPQASFRELPPSISNHMMRSPTPRDKDATDEFSMSGSYFMPRV